MRAGGPQLTSIVEAADGSRDRASGGPIDVLPGTSEGDRAIRISPEKRGCASCRISIPRPFPIARAGSCLVGRGAMPPASVWPATLPILPQPAAWQALALAPPPPVHAGGLRVLVAANSFALRPLAPILPRRSRTHALTHSRTHALTHSRTHALTHSRTHALTHSRTHALTHSRTHALTHSVHAAHRAAGDSHQPLGSL
jgi:hypothetical protein